MEIVLAAVVAALVSGAVVLLAQRTAPRARIAGPAAAPAPAPRVRDGHGAATKERAEPVAAPAPAPETVSDIEHELRERRAEIARAEERILGKEQSLDVRLAELDRRERSLEDRGRNLENQGEELKRARQRQLRELERIAGLSVSQFSRQFKARTGLPPHRFLLRLRVEQAGLLLRTGDDPIADIAARCGFSHQEHLTRVLRAQLGTTPAALRRAG